MTVPHEMLREARARSGESQAQVADALGVTQPCIHKWETGESLPRLKKVRSIADVYGVSHKKLRAAVIAALEARTGEAA